ncbi:sigma-70 family RNA polymerase sigma factor [soil metagenome]
MDHEGQWLESCRTILQSLGQRLLGHTFRGKLDLSGVVQKTLAEATHQPDSSQDRDLRLAWIQVAFRNNLVDEIRRITTARRNVLREESLLDLNHESEPIVADPSPDSILIHTEQLVRMISFLAELPTDQREAIRLRYLETCSVEEVAQRINKSRAAVAGLLRRGMAKLRELLSDGSDLVLT